ncbi:MAG: VCBS repeat-containing protein, partial [Methanobacteriota archaeon]
DGDGNPEIVSGNGYRYNPGYLNIFRYTGGAGIGTPAIYEKVFESDDIGPKAYGLDAADIDGDGIIEIVIGNQPGYIWVFDGSTREVEWKSELLGSDILGIQLYDIDRDGTVEIIAAQGGYQGKADFTSAYTTPHIFIIDGKTYSIEERIGESDYLAWAFQIIIISMVIILLVLLNILVKKKKVQKVAVEKPKEVAASSES